MPEKNGGIEMKLIIRFILWAGKARWIVDNEGDIGFEIFNHAVINYKWNDSFIVYSKNEKENPNYSWRLAEKRELISRNKGE